LVERIGYSADVTKVLLLVHIIETANGLEPYSYLQFLFKQLPGVQFEAHPEFLEKFLP